MLIHLDYVHEIGSWSVEDVSMGIQDLLICFEIFFISLLHHKAFPTTPYERPKVLESVGGDYEEL